MFSFIFEHIKVIEEIFLWKKERFHSAGYRAQVLWLPVECSVIWAAEVPQLFSQKLVNANLATDKPGTT